MMMSDPENNRRKHERFEVSVKIHFHDGKQKCEVEAQNISRGGFFFMHSGVLHIGGMMDFELAHTSFSSRLKLSGRIIHLSSHQGDKDIGCGVEISDVESGSQGVWKEYEALLKQA